MALHSLIFRSGPKGGRARPFLESCATTPLWRPQQEGKLSEHVEHVGAFASTARVSDARVAGTVEHVGAVASTACVSDARVAKQCLRWHYVAVHFSQSFCGIFPSRNLEVSELLSACGRTYGTEIIPFGQFW